MQLPPWGPFWARRVLGLLTLAALLQGSLENCSWPPKLKGAKLKKEFEGIQYFPVGTVIKYDCTEGFRRVPGAKNSAHCGADLKWSYPAVLCKESCKDPPVVTGATIQQAFRGLEYFPPATIVKYDCIAGYIHVPGTENFVVCTSALYWTYPQHFCAVSCSFPPNVKGAKLKTRFTLLKIFPPGEVVMYDCIGIYKRVPRTRNSIKCGDNLQWSQPEVFCKESCNSPPKLKGAKVKRKFEVLEYFPAGTVVKYDCTRGFHRVPGTENSLRCGGDLKWSQPEEFCKESCDWPPKLKGAKVKREFEVLEYFPAGTVVKYDCTRGFQRVPGTENSLRCGGDLKWSQPEEFCKVKECDDPIIEHGVKLTGFRDQHIYGNNIAFECNIGYFMIGSYLIQCGENSTWNPGVPSCKKINAKLCGAPLVPSGSVHPLKAQYELGTNVVIQCNPQYSFPDETMEMITICQGNNLWKPPAQPCMFRTSPDTSVLTICNGRIVHGKKEKYKPGDNVTIKCFPGYTLQGPSVVRYIGGKKWSPTIPYCSLSFFFILLIAALVFFILLVSAKRVYQIYSQEGESTSWT